MYVPDMLYFTVFHLLTAVFDWKKVDYYEFNEIALRSNQMPFYKFFLILEMFKINEATSIRMGVMV